jgi:hypothetical protein
MYAFAKGYKQKLDELMRKQDIYAHQLNRNARCQSGILFIIPIWNNILAQF